MDTNQQSAADWLNKARATIEQRGQQYDKPDGERAMPRIVKMFNAATGMSLTEADGHLFMICLKIARQRQNMGRHHEDSTIDACAYMALMGESLSAPQKAMHKHDCRIDGHEWGWIYRGGAICEYCGENVFGTTEPSAGERRTNGDGR